MFGYLAGRYVEVMYGYVGMFHGDLSRLVVLVVCLELGLLQSDRSSYESVEHCRTSRDNVEESAHLNPGITTHILHAPACCGPGVVGAKPMSLT